MFSTNVGVFSANIYLNNFSSFSFSSFSFPLLFWDSNNLSMNIVIDNIDNYYCHIVIVLHTPEIVFVRFFFQFIFILLFRLANPTDIFFKLTTSVLYLFHSTTDSN